MDFQGLFSAIDRMDAPGFSSFLSEGCTFRMGSYPPIAGRGAIEGFVSEFWSSLASSRHTDLRMYEAGPETRFVEGVVIYGLKNGKEVAVPFLNLLRMRGDQIDEYLIYLDPTPVALAMQS